MSKSSHGSIVRDRVWYLLKAIIDLANHEVDGEDTLRLSTKITWQDKDRHTQTIVANRVTKRELVRLTRLADEKQGLSDSQVLQSLKELSNFLAPTGIFQDNRSVKQGGTGDWHFTLNLWFQAPTDEHRTEFNQKWEDCRPNGAVLLTPQPTATASNSISPEQSSPPESAVLNSTTPLPNTPSSTPQSSIQPKANSNEGNQIGYTETVIINPPSPSSPIPDLPAQWFMPHAIVPTSARIFLSYKRDVWPDEQVALDIYSNPKWVVKFLPRPSGGARISQLNFLKLI